MASSILNPASGHVNDTTSIPCRDGSRPPNWVQTKWLRSTSILAKRAAQGSRCCSLRREAMSEPETKPSPEPEKKPGSKLFKVLKVLLLLVVAAVIAFVGVGLFVLDGKYEVS